MWHRVMPTAPAVWVSMYSTKRRSAQHLPHASIPAAKLEQDLPAILNGSEWLHQSWQGGESRADRKTQCVELPTSREDSNVVVQEQPSLFFLFLLLQLLSSIKRKQRAASCLVFVVLAGLFAFIPSPLQPLQRATAVEPSRVSPVHAKMPLHVPAQMTSCIMLKQPVYVVTTCLHSHMFYTCSRTEIWNILSLNSVFLSFTVAYHYGGRFLNVHYLFAYGW